MEIFCICRLYECVVIIIPLQVADNALVKVFRINPEFRILRLTLSQNVELRRL